MVTLIARHREPPSQQAIQEREKYLEMRMRRKDGFSSSSALGPQPFISPHTHVGGNCPVVTDGHNFPNPPLLLANNFYTHTHLRSNGE